MWLQSLDFSAKNFVSETAAERNEMSRGSDLMRILVLGFCAPVFSLTVEGPGGCSGDMKCCQKPVEFGILFPLF